MPIKGSGPSQSALDDRYVNVTGDSMSGDLEFTNPNTGLILRSTSGSGIVTGNPIGLLLALTYSSDQGTVTRWRVTVDTSGHLITTQL